MERSYDYRAKNEVRKRWLGFLPSHRVENRTAYGLYLPAPENLELPGYRERGFTAARLIGAENDEERFPAVEKNAGGITVIRGSVQDAVRSLVERQTPFLSFVNLDFEGSYNSNLQDLLSVFRVFPAEPTGYLAVTSYAARDDDALIQGVVNSSKFYAGLGMDMGRFFQEFGVMMNRYRALCKHLDSDASEHANLSRELGFLWWIAIGMGMTAYPRGAYGVRNETFLKRVEGILSDIARRVLALERGTEFALVAEPSLAPLLREQRCGLWPKSIEHLGFKTRRHQPMRTWLIEIERIEDPSEQFTVQEVLDQLWQLALRTPLDFIDETGSTITIK